MTRALMLTLLYSLPGAALAAETCTCTASDGSCGASVACPANTTAVCNCSSSGCSATCDSGTIDHEDLSISLVAVGPAERVLDRVAEVLGVALAWDGELPVGEVGFSVEADGGRALLDALSEAVGVRVRVARE